jgi:hypothetical protein
MLGIEVSVNCKRSVVFPCDLCELGIDYLHLSFPRRPPLISFSGLEALWSPWIGISVPYPCATALTLALVLALALALALAPARLGLALPTRPLHRLTTLRRRPRRKNKKYVTVTRRKSFLLAWFEAHEHRQDPGENGRRSNISLARTSICIK